MLLASAFVLHLIQSPISKALSVRVRELSSLLPLGGIAIPFSTSKSITDTPLVPFQVHRRMR